MCGGRINPRIPCARHSSPVSLSSLSFRTRNKSNVYARIGPGNYPIEQHLAEQHSDREAHGCGKRADARIYATCRRADEDDEREIDKNGA